jgi:hypothetical protein
MNRTITEAFTVSAQASCDFRSQAITVRDKEGENSIIFEFSQLPAEQIAYAVRSYINGLRWNYSDNEADKVANFERAKSILECAQRSVEYLTTKEAAA